jgi:hypothetical protein
MNHPSIPISGTPTHTISRPTWAVRGYQLLTTLFWIAVIVQGFLAGAGIFAGGSWLTAHIIFGHLLSSPLPLIPLLIVALAYIAKLPGGEKGLAWWLLLLAILQPFWLYMRGINILLAAVHPLNALLLSALPIYMLMRVRRLQA